MTTVEKIRSSIKQFEVVQKRNREFGAMDTEPDHAFQYALVKAMKGEISIPVSANQWELYSDMDGAESASVDLYIAAKEAVESIHNCPISELQEVKKYLKSYCWRCF